jgi:hypothetical protein
VAFLAFFCDEFSLLWPTSVARDVFAGPIIVLTADCFNFARTAFVMQLVFALGNDNIVARTCFLLASLAWIFSAIIELSHSSSASCGQFLPRGCYSHQTTFAYVPWQGLPQLLECISG